MDQNFDYERAVNRRAAFYASSDFQEWKAEHFDARREKILADALEASKLMTAEGCYRAAFLLNLYRELGEMSLGAQMRAEMERVMLEDRPE